MGRCQWGGRISDTKGRVRWECDRVQGEGRRSRDGGMGMGCAGMQNEEISKETVGEWGDYLPYTWS
jgi:hypothetical protein